MTSRSYLPPPPSLRVNEFLITILSFLFSFPFWRQNKVLDQKFSKILCRCIFFRSKFNPNQKIADIKSTIFQLWIMEDYEFCDYVFRESPVHTMKRQCIGTLLIWYGYIKGIFMTNFANWENL